MRKWKAVTVEIICVLAVLLMMADSSVIAGERGGGKSSRTGLSKAAQKRRVNRKPAVLFRSGGKWAKANAALRADVKRKNDLWIDHSAGYLVPKDLYYDKHPEYYSMLGNGKRIAKDAFTYHRTPLCLSNPSVTEISIERALKWVKQQKWAKYFPITYGDSGAWCQCPECLKMDPERGQYAKRLLTWVNAVARAVGAEYPDKIITTFAYGGTDVAPPGVKLEKNVWIIVAVGYAGIPFWDHGVAAGMADGSNGKIDPWLKAAPDQVAVCEYEGQYYPALVDTIAGKSRFYAEKGIRCVFFTYGRPKNFWWLWDIIYPRLLADPTLDAHKLAAGFIAGHYGPAARHMQAYFDLCRKRYKETLGTPLAGTTGYPEGFYSSEFTDQALACFDRAAKAVGGNKRLVREIRAEQKLFVKDWVENTAAREMTPAAEKALRKQCSIIAKLSGDSPSSPDAKRIAVANEIHKLGVAAEQQLKGSLAVVEQWLKEQKFPKPKLYEKLRGGGVRVPALAFMYAGYSGVYGGLDHLVPRKRAAAVYVKGNKYNRSHRMEAIFELDRIPGDGAAILNIEGQDSDHDVPPAEIRIEINGKRIFQGPVTVVKYMWSRQEFKIPAGVLRKGENKIEILNSVDLSKIKRWYERWFMLTEAVIRFDG